MYCTKVYFNLKYLSATEPSAMIPQAPLSVGLAMLDPFQTVLVLPHIPK